MGVVPGGRIREVSVSGYGIFFNNRVRNTEQTIALNKTETAFEI